MIGLIRPSAWGFLNQPTGRGKTDDDIRIAAAAAAVGGDWI